MAFGQKKFKFRLQIRPATKGKPRRVTLVAQRKIIARGKVINAGTDVTQAGALKQIVAKPRTRGRKIANGA